MGPRIVSLPDHDVTDCYFVKGSSHETAVIVNQQEGGVITEMGGEKLCWGGGVCSARFCVSGSRLRAAQGTKA